MFGIRKPTIEQIERSGDFGGTNFIDEVDGVWLSDAACSVRNLTELALDDTMQTIVGSETEEQD